MFVKQFPRLAAVTIVIGAWGTTAIAANLSGEVQIEGSKRLRNVVVYLVYRF